MQSEGDKYPHSHWFSNPHVTYASVNVHVGHTPRISNLHVSYRMSPYASVNVQVGHARCIRSIVLADKHHNHGAHSPCPQLCQFGLVPGRPFQMRGRILKLGVAVCSQRHSSEGRVASELPPRDRSTKRRLEDDGVHLFLEAVHHRRMLPKVCLHANRGSILHGDELAG